MNIQFLGRETHLLFQMKREKQKVPGSAGLCGSAAAQRRDGEPSLPAAAKLRSDLLGYEQPLSFCPFLGLRSGLPALMRRRRWGGEWKGFT